MSWQPVSSPYNRNQYGVPSVSSPYNPYQYGVPSRPPIGEIIERIVIERFVSNAQQGPTPYYGMQPWQGATPSYGSTMLQPGWYGSSVFPNGHYIPRAVPQLLVGQAPPTMYPMAGPFFPRPMPNVPIVHRPPSISMPQRPPASFVPPAPVSNPSLLVGETNAQPLSPDVVQNQVDVRVHQTATQVLSQPIVSSLPAESDLQRAHNIPQTANSSTLPVPVEKETSLGTLPPHVPTTDNAEQAMQLPKQDNHSLHPPKSRKQQQGAKSKQPPVQENITSYPRRNPSTSKKQQHASSSGNKSGAGDSKRSPPKPQVKKDDRVGGPSSALQVASQPPTTLQESETTPPFKDTPTSTLPLPPLSVPTMPHADMGLESIQQIGGSESKKKSTTDQKEQSKQAEPTVQSKKPKSKKEPGPSLHVYRSPFSEIRKQLEYAIPIPADSEFDFQYSKLIAALEEVKKTKGSSVSSKSGEQSDPDPQYQGSLRKLSLQCELFAQQFARLRLQKEGQTPLHKSPDHNRSECLKQLEEALEILFSGLAIWKSEDRWAALLSPWIVQSVPNGGLTTELQRVDSMSNALPKETAQLVQLCTVSRVHLEERSLQEALSSCASAMKRKQAASRNNQPVLPRYLDASTIMLTLRNQVRLEKVDDAHPIARLLGAMQLAQPLLQSSQEKTSTVFWPSCLAQTLLFIELWPSFLKFDRSSRVSAGGVGCYQTICEWGMVQAHQYLTKELTQSSVRHHGVQDNPLGYLSLYSAITRLHLPLIQPLFQKQKKLKHEVLQAAAQKIVELIPMLKEIGKPILGQDSLSIVEKRFLKEELEPYYLALARFVSTYSLHDGLLAQASEAERVLFQLGLGSSVTTDAHPLQWQHVCPPHLTYSLGSTQEHAWEMIEIPISYARPPSPGFWDPMRPAPLHFGRVFDEWLEDCRKNADVEQQRGTLQHLPLLEHSVAWCTKWAAATYDDLQRTILGQRHQALPTDSSCFTQCISIEEWEKNARVYQTKCAAIQGLWDDCMAIMKVPTNEKQLALNITPSTTLQQLQDEVQEVTRTRLLPAFTPFVAFLQDVKVDPPSLWLWNQLGLQLIDIIALHLYTEGCVRIVNGMNHSKELSRNPLQGILSKLHDREIRLIGILEQWLTYEAGLAGCVYEAEESPNSPSYAMMWVLQQRPYTIHEEQVAYVFPWAATGNAQQNGQDIALCMQPISMQDVDSWYSESEISDPIYQQMQEGMKACLDGVRRESEPFNQAMPKPSLVEIPDDLFQVLRQIPWMHWVLPERKEEVDRVVLFTFLTHLWLRRLIGVPMVIECQLPSQTSSLQQTRDAIRTMAQTAHHILHGPELPAPSVWDEAVNQQVTEPSDSLFRVPLDQVILLI